MSNTVTGKLVGGVVNLAGSTAAGLRSDGYNFASGKYLNPVQRRDQRIDSFINLATLPIGMGSVGTARLEISGGKTVWQQSFASDKLTFSKFSENYAKRTYRSLDMTINERGLLARERDLAESAGWQRIDGSTWWPPYDGALPGTQRIVSLQPSLGATPKLIDRFGLPTGSYVSPAGASLESRALRSPPLSPPSLYSVDGVIDGVERATIAPWFGKPGLGIQYKLPNSVQYYLDATKLGVQ